MLTIAEANDQFRKAVLAAPQKNGKALTTATIHGLGELAVAHILERVRTFDTFTEENDPWKEHDFGSFDFGGQTVNWKIDYYSDETLQYGAEDEQKENNTCYRVLTIYGLGE